MKGAFAAEIDEGTATIISEDDLEIDFSLGTVSFRNETFRFPPPGAVPQRLVVAGGSENLIKKKLGLGG